MFWNGRITDAVQVLDDDDDDDDDVQEISGDQGADEIDGEAVVKWSYEETEGEGKDAGDTDGDGAVKDAEEVIDTGHGDWNKMMCRGEGSQTRLGTPYCGDSAIT